MGGVASPEILSRASHHRAALTPGQRNRALTAIARLVSHWRAWESHRRDLEMLAHDDGMLADVGLSRADALAAGNQPFWRDPRRGLAARAEERQAAQDRAHKL